MARTFGFSAGPEQSGGMGLSSVDGQPVEGVASVTGNNIDVHVQPQEPIAVLAVTPPAPTADM